MSASPGGYEEAYSACRCVWGMHPGSLFAALKTLVGPVAGLRVLDVGCGEGKNTMYLSGEGAHVDAFDLSFTAVSNGMRLWPDLDGVNRFVADVQRLPVRSQYHGVVLYGVLHCLSSPEAVSSVIRMLQDRTLPGGFHVVCVFNDRLQELADAHPGFSPTLLKHEWYLQAYAGWRLVLATDSDLREAHPHNLIEHRHSLTRLIACRTRQ